MSDDVNTMHFTVGKVGEPGAAILHVTGSAPPLGGPFVGHGRITKAIEGPWGHVKLPEITGTLTDGPIVGIRRLTLAGHFTVGKSEIVYDFAATIELSEGMTGTGEFTYGPYSGSGPVKRLVEAAAV
jgi:hypothetical protein